jgi:hypothetical protein
MTPDEQEDLVSRIDERYANYHPMTIQDIAQNITERYRTTMDANSIRHMLVRDPLDKPCNGLPMEERRLQTTAESIAAHFERLNEVIDGVSAHFVYNMDEMGHQELADRQK